LRSQPWQGGTSFAVAQVLQQHQHPRQLPMRQAGLIVVLHHGGNPSAALREQLGSGQSNA
jgi:hypothetical protein